MARRILGLEAKGRDTVARRDTRGLRAVAEALDEEWLGGLLVTKGRAIDPVDQEHALWQVPLHRLVS